MDPLPKKVRSEADRDGQIEKLTQINGKLRQKIKDLNSLVEKVIERQTLHQQNSIQKENNKIHMENLIMAREKEIQNAKKQIDMNDVQIAKLNEKLSKVQLMAEKSGTATIDWETRYREQRELQTKLEAEIKRLEKQNQTQGVQIQRATDTEDQAMRLKTLTEELRVWKQKVATLASQIEKE